MAETERSDPEYLQLLKVLEERVQRSDLSAPAIELAMGLEQGALGSILEGRTGVTLQELVGLADLLGVEAAELFLEARERLQTLQKDERYVRLTVGELGEVVRKAVREELRRWIGDRPPA